MGEIRVRVMFSPGHTLASVTYVAGDAAFVHDTPIMPDSGSSRADCSGELHRSVAAILALPDATHLYVRHDYAPNGREAMCEATVAEHKKANIHAKDGIDEARHRAVRDARDATLPLPNLMLAALQIDIWGGRKPPPEKNGRSCLKLPLDRFEIREADQA